MEDWQKKYYSNRTNGLNPLNQPIPTTRAPSLPMQQGQGSTREIDVGQELMNRMMSRINPGQNTNGFLPRDFVPQQQMQNAPRQINLIPGKPFYRQIQTGGFGAGITNMVRESGIIAENGSKNVFLKKETKGYIVDNLSVVDLQNLELNNDRIVSLFEIEIPFIGKILVTQDCIQEMPGVQTGVHGKQILRG